MLILSLKVAYTISYILILVMYGVKPYQRHLHKRACPYHGISHDFFFFYLSEKRG